MDLDQEPALLKNGQGNGMTKKRNVQFQWLSSSSSPLSSFQEEDSRPLLPGGVPGSNKETNHVLENSADGSNRSSVRSSRVIHISAPENRPTVFSSAFVKASLPKAAVMTIATRTLPGPDALILPSLPLLRSGSPPGTGLGHQASNQLHGGVGGWQSHRDRRLPVR